MDRDTNFFTDPGPDPWKFRHEFDFFVGQNCFQNLFKISLNQEFKGMWPTSYIFKLSVIFVNIVLLSKSRSCSWLKSLASANKAPQPSCRRTGDKPEYISQFNNCFVMVITHKNIALLVTWKLRIWALVLFIDLTFCHAYVFCILMQKVVFANSKRFSCLHWFW